MTNLAHELKRAGTNDIHEAPVPLVLIVEDHDDTRFMLRTMMEMRGVRVAEAVDGEAGVRATEELRPDLVLMDNGLPLMDGPTATRRIREREEGQRVPIVIVSGHAALASQAEAFAAGCDDYLIKPIDFDELGRVFKHYLCRKWDRTVRRHGYDD